MYLLFVACVFSCIVGVHVTIFAYIVHVVLDGPTRGQTRSRGKEAAFHSDSLKCCLSPATYSERRICYCAVTLKHQKDGVIPDSVTAPMVRAHIASSWSVLYVTLIPEGVYYRHAKLTQDARGSHDVYITGSIFLALEGIFHYLPCCKHVCLLHAILKQRMRCCLCMRDLFQKNLCCIVY